MEDLLNFYDIEIYVGGNGGAHENDHRDTLRKKTGRVHELRKLFLDHLLLGSREKQGVFYCIGIRQIILMLPILLLYKKHQYILVISGLGSLFYQKSLIAKLIKFLVIKSIYLLSGRRHIKAIVQNSFDEKLMRDSCNINDTLRVNGSGVDLALFPKQKIKKNNDVIFVGRLLKEKGLLEFIAACDSIASKHKDWNFKIYGDFYDKNPSAVSEAELMDYIKNTNIQYCGHSKEIPNILMSAKILCIPSYHEGMPKVLLEGCAASCGIAVSNIEGCTDVIEKEKNGLIVEPKSSVELALAIDELMSNPEKLTKFADAARDLAERKFDVRFINNRITNFLRDKYEKSGLS